MPTRRHFMQGLGAAGLAALAAPRLAHANLVGAQVGCHAYKVLHIYLHGAMSHRETFWVDDDSHGWAPWRQPANLGDIDGADAGATRTPFAEATDHLVWLGEGLHPLIDAGLGHRIRIAAMSTPTPGVHRLASGSALCGVDVGRPGFASLASRMLARHYAEDPFASFVVDALGRPVVSRYASSNEGLAPESQPVVLPIGSAGSDFLEDLDREGRDHVDGLMGYYRSQYEARLRHPTAGRLRSRAFDTYTNTIDRLIGWPGLQERLQAVPNFADVGGGPWSATTSGIDVASHLLQSGARHVTVLGGGANDNNLDTHALGSIGGGDFDLHAERHNGYLWHVCNALREAIGQERIDLDDTLIFVHSEFGRFQDDNGTEHYTPGYAAMLFGGPVQQHGLAGRLDFSSSVHGVAVPGESFAPIDMVAAVALAGGVSPFQPGMFAREQLSGSFTSDEHALEHLSHELLGAVEEDCTIDGISG